MPCIPLNISTDAVAFDNANFGAGAGPIYLDNVDCSGNECNLLDCSRGSLVICYSRHRSWRRTYYTWRGGAAVRCQGKYDILLSYDQIAKEGTWTVLTVLAVSITS